MAQQPWVTGPSEILQHGLSLLKKDSDSNRRLAMISIDNAVELAIKTYLSLPRRITGINLSRKEYQEISESFPQLLDAMEKHVSEKLGGIDLGEIEWFHRLRNQLYHQGNGLTVDKDKVKIYAELAKLLFRNLFGFDIQFPEEKDQELLGLFIATWGKLEKTLTAVAIKNNSQTNSNRVVTRLTLPSYALKDLYQSGIVSKDTKMEIERIGIIRNQVVHGTEDFKSAVTPELVSKVWEIKKELDKIADTL